ncbi:MAG: SusC/RagA family TonB-linked outer membrane protein [Fermentimonas sp.]
MNKSSIEGNKSLNNLKHTFKIMRITLFLLFLGFLCSQAATSYSQGVELSLDSRSLSIKDVCEEIERKSDFRFVFASNAKALLKKKVDIELDSRNIEEILNTMLTGTEFSYRILDNQVVIYHENTKVTSENVKEIIPELTQQQQKKRITGTITDVNGTTIIGANIVEVGTTNGTITDVAGRFTLRVEENATILISYIGYLPQEISVAGKTDFEVILKEDTKALDEVVVVGYGTIRKINLTGAVDQIDSEIFENITVPNVSRALQGQIPGLNITFNSGRPTDSPSYNVRGLTSIGAGGSALVLIDGVEGDVRNLNPNDIENVSVLKDASSAAIYGSRGAFGVVLITTKKPQKEQQFNYSTTFSLNSRTAQRDVLKDSYIWSKMYWQSFYNLYGGTRTPTSVGSVGINFNQDYIQELKYRAENPDHGHPEAVADPATGFYMYYGNTDWWKLLYKDNMPSMEHSLSTSGGSDIASYYISGRYYQQDGLYNIRTDKYKTYDFRSKGSVKPFEWLNINGNLAYSSNGYVDPFSGANIWNNMYIRSGATPMGIPRNPDGTYTQIGSQTIGVLEGKSYTDTKRNQLSLNADFEATLLKEKLSLKGDFTYKNQIIETNRKHIPVPYSNRPGDIVNVGDTYLYNDRSTLNYYAYNLYGTFQNVFDDHSLQILAGTNIELSKTRFLNVNRNNILLEELDAFNVVTGDNLNISGGGSDWANAGIFSRLNYNFKEKYLIELNARYDGSSKFPAHQQFAFFPSISLGWRVSEESFLQNTNHWLDNLKPRFSYGSLGNSLISPYMYIEKINAYKTSKIIQGERPVVIRNPEVMADGFTWETSTTFDLGLDIDLFNYRLGIVFDYFKRTTSNMITSGPVLPAVFGASSPRGNYAELYTEGFELTVKWNGQIQSTKPFYYGIRFALSDSQSFITKFNNPNGSLIIDPDYRTAGYYEGMKVGDIWGLTTLGLFADQDDIDNHVNQNFIQSNIGGQPAQPGDIKFKDINNDGKIDWGDRTIHNPGDLSIIGNMSPRFNFGIGLNGNYGDFSVSAFFQGVGKRDWYPTHHQNPFWGPYGYWAAEIPKHFLKNAYHEDNPDPNAYWPLWKGNMAYGNRQLQPQTRYLQNTAYIRLKDLTIAYSAKKIAEKIGMKDIQLFISGQNIWTYSPVFKISRDIDPEQMDGGVGTYYPMLKSYNLGFNLSF